MALTYEEILKRVDGFREDMKAAGFDTCVFICEETGKGRGKGRLRAKLTEEQAHILMHCYGAPLPYHARVKLANTLMNGLKSGLRNYKEEGFNGQINEPGSN